MASSGDSPQTSLEAGVSALQEVALRGTAAARFQIQTEERLLQLIVDATVSLFGALAASIALFERDPDRLEYRVAGGEQTGDVVGMSVAPTQGIVGYVFSTGESVALSDLPGDPRFDKTIAEETGYFPRSVAAVPLVSEGAVVGVLEVFDREGGESFSVRDMEVLAAFAAQAGAAIGGTRVQHDLPLLLVNSLRQIAPDLGDEQVQAVVSTATRHLDADANTPFWTLVDQVSRLRDLGESELELVGDILEVVASHRTHIERIGRRSLR
jgi:signal transduction protein with GAF and PtsI domain